jgi:hypothetical protein
LNKCVSEEGFKLDAAQAETALTSLFDLTVEARAEYFSTHEFFETKLTAVSTAQAVRLSDIGLLSLREPQGGGAGTTITATTASQKGSPHSSNGGGSPLHRLLVTGGCQRVAGGKKESSTIVADMARFGRWQAEKRPDDEKERQRVLQVALQEAAERRAAKEVKKDSGKKVKPGKGSRACAVM